MYNEITKRVLIRLAPAMPIRTESHCNVRNVVKVNLLSLIRRIINGSSDAMATLTRFSFRLRLSACPAQLSV